MSVWGGPVALNAAQRNEEFECQTIYKSKTTSPILCLHAAGGLVYAGTNGGEVLVWNCSFGEDAPTQRFTVERNAPVRAVQAAGDGLVHCGVDQRVVTLDADSGEIVYSAQREGSQGLVAVLLAKNGLVYAGYTDGCVRVWKDGEWKGSYRGHQGTVLSLTVVGREMFTGSKDQTIMTWSLKEAKPHVIWRGKSPQNGAIRGIEVHRGTVWFADGTRVLAQNIATGTRVFKCEGHEGIVKRIVLHAASDTLYSIADDREVRVWDTNTGAQVASCRGHTAALNSICVDERGFLFSASADHTVREWATPSLIDAAAQMEPLAAGAAAKPKAAAAAASADDPPKPRKAAPKRTGSVAAFAPGAASSSSTASRDSSDGQRSAAPPRKEAPKRGGGGAAPKSSDLELLEALDDDQVPLDKIDDVATSDWDDIDNLLDFGDL